MNIPNILTTIRFFLIPIFGYFLYEGQYIWSVIVLTISGLTDILDGFIARKFNMVTSWGKLADPLADKLMQLTALILLSAKNKIPLIIVIIFILKELMMVIGSYLLYKQDKVVVSANWYGKMATVIIYFAVILIMFNVPYGIILAIIAVAAALFSFFMYISNFLKIKAGRQKERD
ncbi:MAG: CDP-alcohol phosphatidyltransferase family protein [Firmicutes bacterium]|nr:CDP-alcohol phosphatidyltransferase family protein [Bacillota bacterium]